MTQVGFDLIIDNLTSIVHPTYTAGSFPTNEDIQIYFMEKFCHVTFFCFKGKATDERLNSEVTSINNDPFSKAQGHFYNWAILHFLCFPKQCKL